MHTDIDSLNEITEKIIGAAFQVSNTLGAGFLEKVYENALALELRKQGLQVEQQKPIQVLYEGTVVGEYVADLFIESAVVVELKACKQLDPMHMAQCLNYLKATDLKVALLFNFGSPKLEIKRVMN